MDFQQEGVKDRPATPPSTCAAGIPGKREIIRDYAIVGIL